MDRKKRPGWIRGDAFDIEASHAEILSLNRKIRELEKENAELKSQIVKRVPELVAAVVLDQQDDEEVDGMQPFYSARSLPIIDPAIFNNSHSSVFESISIRDNSIFAECNQLPHKDDTEFDGIYIVPARKGKLKASVSLRCSEYIEPKVHDIEFEIV